MVGNKGITLIRCLLKKIGGRNMSNHIEKPCVKNKIVNITIPVLRTKTNNKEVDEEVFWTVSTNTTNNNVKITTQTGDVVLVHVNSLQCILEEYDG